MKITDLVRHLIGHKLKNVPVFNSAVEALRRHEVEVDVRTYKDSESCNFEQGLKYCMWCDKSDPKGLSIAAPNIYEITPSNELHALRSMVKVSSIYKLVKLVRVDNSVHISVDQYVGDNDSMDEVLGRAFRIAEEAFREFHKEMEKQDDAKPVKVIGFH